MQIVDQGDFSFPSSSLFIYLKNNLTGNYVYIYTY